MKLKLVSHKQCPFVQRAIIVLDEKSVAHDVEYVDLQNKPEWFVKLSPRGKVPVLVADGVTLFESAAICEFLEETHPEPALMPKDPVQRARDRGWFATASEDLYAPNYKLTTAKTQEDVATVLASLDKTLTRLDEELGTRAFLSGDGNRFGMADVFMAPYFVRAQVLSTVAPSPIPERLGRVRAYADRLLARDSVKRSIPAGFAEDTIARMRASDAAVLRR
ncbi:MAG TPA: glutathione S-transferase family protein [Myxococcota bacterium]